MTAAIGGLDGRIRAGSYGGCLKCPYIGRPRRPGHFSLQPACQPFALLMETGAQRAKRIALPSVCPLHQLRDILPRNIGVAQGAQFSRHALEAIVVSMRRRWG